MPKIAFWNTQRSRGFNTAASDSGVTVGEDIAGIADMVQPDVIVLCELLDGFSDSGRLYAPSGYRFVSISEHHAGYFDRHTLRFGVLSRSSVWCHAYLLPTVKNAGKSKARPALGVKLASTISFVAIHAVSGSAPARVKLKQAEHAAAAMKELMPRAHRRSPDVIVGDFNINLAELSPASVAADLNDTGPLAGYKVKATRHGTQARGGNKVKPDATCKMEIENTEGFTSKLDWALVNGSIMSFSIGVVKPQVLGTRSIRNPFLNQKRSDHLPICVKW